LHCVDLSRRSDKLRSKWCLSAIDNARAPASNSAVTLDLWPSIELSCNRWSKSCDRPCSQFGQRLKSIPPSVQCPHGSPIIFFQRQSFLRWQLSNFHEKTEFLQDHIGNCWVAFACCTHHLCPAKQQLCDHPCVYKVIQHCLSHGIAGLKKFLFVLLPGMLFS